MAEKEGVNMAKKEQKWRLNMASGGTKNGQKLPKMGVTLVTHFLKK